MLAIEFERIEKYCIDLVEYEGIGPK